MSAALVILAAGASRRLGRCKALVELGGSTALERLLAAGACCDGAPPLLITGAHHLELEAAAPAQVELLHNPDWSAGRTGGVQLALDARPGLDLLLAPVDVPLVPGLVFSELLAGWERAGAPPRGWLAPCCPPPGEQESRPGHPVLVGRTLLEDLRALPPGAPLRQLREGADPLWTVAVPSQAIHDDLDTAHDLERLRLRIDPA